MNYNKPPGSRPIVRPRVIIHGGAGNIRPELFTPAKYATYREALMTIITKTQAYMTSNISTKTREFSNSDVSEHPTALDTATYAVTLFEDNPLFNCGRGAVFTRDGINELEASVMVSSGYPKRGVGVTGLRRVKHPILLAKAILAHGSEDLIGKQDAAPKDPDVPSAQGHILIHGPTAEKLAGKYDLEMVEPGYFFTQLRWDEHIRALEREKAALKNAPDSLTIATWSPDEFLPQGTTGCVALDEYGMICAATSTGGLTNKLTGRIGDTPVVGAGFWAEKWTEEGALSMGPRRDQWNNWRQYFCESGPIIELSASLRSLLADCLPTAVMYSSLHQPASRKLVTTRSVGTSGTGNGDSFLRIAAARTVGAIAKYSRVSAGEALRRVIGKDGELQKSAGLRWGRSGEGEGGMIGLECILIHDESTGEIVDTKGEVLQDYNCGGMYRAWIDDDDKPSALIFDGTKDRDFWHGTE